LVEEHPKDLKNGLLHEKKPRDPNQLSSWGERVVKQAKELDPIFCLDKSDKEIVSAIWVHYEHMKGKNKVDRCLNILQGLGDSTTIKLS
jgi:hypothetical protein